MCAILDANAASAVFGRKGGTAGQAFFDWINQGRGTLVIGGKLRQELGHIRDFLKWHQQAVLVGRITTVDDRQVDDVANQLKDRNLCTSDDQHIVALAQVSGARLLYTNDKALQSDFGDHRLINKPRGKVYSTVEDTDVNNVHRRLLARNVCRSRGS